MSITWDFRTFTNELIGKSHHIIKFTLVRDTDIVKIRNLIMGHDSDKFISPFSLKVVGEM